MATINTLKIYEILKQKLPEEEAKLITEAIQVSFKEGKDVLATKEDIAKLREEVKEEISTLRVEIARTEARLIRWMFIFWATQLGGIIGILFAFFR